MRAIPDDNLAYPILLRHETGQRGSGFYMAAGDDTFLITAKHVLFSRETGELISGELNLISYPKDLADPGRIEWNLDLHKLENQGKIKGHSDSDVALVHIATKTGEGNRVEVANGVEIHSTTKAPLVQVIMSESTKP